MSDSLRVAIAQLDQLVGDVKGNVERIDAAGEWAESVGADVLVTPELSIPGYPPEDLLLREDFVDTQRRGIRYINRFPEHCTIVAGYAEAVDPLEVFDTSPRRLHNSAALVHNGGYQVVRKRLLPDYGVFDEPRHFRPGPDEILVHTIGGIHVAVMICEDLWSEELVARTVAAGAQIILSINASPWYVGKREERMKVAMRAGIPVVWVNQVGGQDGVVYDGRSFVMGVTPGEENRFIFRELAAFEEDRLVVDLAPLTERDPAAEAIFISGPRKDRPPLALAAVTTMPPSCEEEEVWRGIVLGLRDYVTKNKFTSVLLGLSGGIDSAVVAALAVDALGPEKVLGVLMPSSYSSEGSVADAIELADRLHIETYTLPIADPFDAVLRVLHGSEEAELGPFDGDTASGLAEENIQARLRGIYLMAISNRFVGTMVLSTSNRSEAAVGYSTLYGDSNGGLAPLCDVPKTLVYRLAEWRNTQSLVIPESTITKPPSAELAPGQQDSDSLPPYPVLDRILELYIDHDQSPLAIRRAMQDEGWLDYEAAETTVNRIVGLVDRAEYKRRQAPPVIKIGPKVFGRDRRMPITNAYSGATAGVISPELVTEP
jgi:NAD+ synthase (glutamine-hydrolysing)